MAFRFRALFPDRNMGFDYLSRRRLRPGALIRAPLRGREKVGCVWDEEIDETLPPSRLKYAEPIAGGLRPAFVGFLRFVARWNCVPPNLPLKAALSGFHLPKRPSVESNARSKKEALAPPRTETRLSEGQQRAFKLLKLGKSAVNLLDGLTGSGKTWVYFEAVANALAKNRQTLILIPEIALTEQWQSNFEKRFGFEARIWHSKITPAERRRLRRDAVSGEAKVIVGARSALFIPLKNPGLIVVDEEHDIGYKQEEGFCYHARDMAVARGRAEKAAVILASATPSIESLRNVELGKYHRVVLSRKFAAAARTKTELVDLTRHRPPLGSWLSPPLASAVKETVGEDGQAMLFINRRGYAPATVCASCRSSFDCPSCSSLLVLHSRRKEMVCHYCGYARPSATSCPECGGSDLLHFGPGVERLAEEVKSMLPKALIVIASSDYLAADGDLLAKVIRGEADVIIGTQLLAKGHHFPKLRLVGVVDADMGIKGGDPRAAERTWQMLHQLSGRVGRQAPGLALIQTHFPAHPVMQALVAEGREAFLAKETQSRLQESLPPFGSLAALVISAADKAAGERAAEKIRRAAPAGQGLEALGPAPAAIERLGGRWRWRALLKSEKRRSLAPIMADWLRRAGPSPSVRVKVDIDPYNFL